MTRNSSAARTAMVCLLLGTLSAPAMAQGRGENTVAKAIEVITQMSRSRDTQLPVKLLREAQGIAIIPDQFKAGFVFGARYGRGLLLVRKEDGSWSDPVFISTFGGSFGLQAGAQATDLILVFRGKRSMEKILQNRGKLTLGLDASVAAGPLGRAAEAGTDARLRAEILSYSRNRGVFAGISAGGGTLQIDKKVNLDYYGQPATPAEILGPGGEITAPKSAQRLRRALAGQPGGQAEEDLSDAPETGAPRVRPRTHIEGGLPRSGGDPTDSSTTDRRP